MVEGTDGMLYGMEVDVEAAKAELREIASKDHGKGATDFLKNVGLGSFAEQLQDLKLGRAHLQRVHSILWIHLPVKRGIYGSRYWICIKSCQCCRPDFMLLQQCLQSFLVKARLRDLG